MLLVLGNATIDEAMAVDGWPAPGETVIVGAPRHDLGGKGANQALVAHRAGARLRFVAPVGRDAPGATIAAALAEEGLDPADLIEVAAPTDRSLIFVGRDGENAIASITGAAASLDAGMAEQLAGALGPADQLLLQGNLSARATAAALLVARRRGAATLFNPSPLLPEFRDLLPLVDLVVVNASEGAALVGPMEPAAIVLALREAGAAGAVLTLGGHGVHFAGRAAQGHVPARAVPVVDTTGAGDTFMGVLAAALHYHGFDLAGAVAAANDAAAVTVGRHGTLAAFPSRAEIAAILDRHRATG
ncbi:ribokinase [Aureimonas endophytica]|uniref:Ribokinase n=1 Tax=Aureimonas endophytica TaxID=2027858 RepID=A0A916ZF39_9HYPH|nr:PfkB family carbohydrate kinase [Aureimonas endophytica]GGD91809.1 ribokinase [Aureimonas endophytica]